MKKNLSCKFITEIGLFFVSICILYACSNNTSENEEASLPTVANNPSNTVVSAATPDAATAEEESIALTAAPSGITEMIKADPEDMLWMRDISPVKLSVFMNFIEGGGGYLYSPWGADPTTAWITERTGVTLEVEFAPDTEGTRLNLMMASGEKLPDIIHGVSFNSPIASQLISGGYVLAAEDLINEYAPEFWDIYEPFQKDFLTIDGKMWSFSNGLFLDGDYPYGYMYGYIQGRTDVLDAVGYDYLGIKTLDDFYAVLERFDEIRDQFPEVQFPIYIKGIRSQYASIFGDVGSGNIKYNEAEDSLYFWWENDAGRKVIELFNDFYLRGWLHEETIVTTNDVRDDLRAGKSIFYFEGNTWAAWLGAPIENGNPDAWWTGMYPFSAVGEPMMRIYKGVNDAVNCRWITADSENPVRALGFLEYMSTVEGSTTIHKGKYGEHWEVGYDKDNNPYPKAIGAAREALNEGRDVISEFGFNRWFEYRFYYTFPHNFLWNYDVFMMNEKTPGFVVDAWKIWYNKTTDNRDLTGTGNFVAVAAGSDEGVILGAINDIATSEIMKAVFANSPEESEQIYQNMLNTIDKAGRNEFFEMVRTNFDIRLELYKTALEVNYTR